MSVIPQSWEKVRGDVRTCEQLMAMCGTDHHLRRHVTGTVVVLIPVVSQQHGIRNHIGDTVQYRSVHRNVEYTKYWQQYSGTVEQLDHATVRSLARRHFLNSKRLCIDSRCVLIRNSFETAVCPFSSLYSASFGSFSITSTPGYCAC